MIELQAADGVHGAGQLFDDLVEGQVAEIMGSQGAGHPEADVGRTGAHGQAVLMGNLVVVGRQPRGVCADKGREIAPGPPGHLPEEAAGPFPAAVVPAAARPGAGSGASRAAGRETREQARGAACGRLAGMMRQIAQPTVALKRLPSARLATNSGWRREALQWVAWAVHSSRSRREIRRR